MKDEFPSDRSLEHKDLKRSESSSDRYPALSVDATSDLEAKVLPKHKNGVITYVGKLVVEEGGQYYDYQNKNYIPKR